MVRRKSSSLDDRLDLRSKEKVTILGSSNFSYFFLSFLKNSDAQNNSRIFNKIVTLTTSEHERMASH